MKVLQGFLSHGEVENLKLLWVEHLVGGWAVGGDRKYEIVPIEFPPLCLLDKTLPELPKKPGLIYVESFFIHYGNGGYTMPHTDFRTGHRINILLVAPEEGELVINGLPVPMKVGDGVVFEPDTEMHEVTPIKGERLIWSVGRTRLEPYKARRK
jgi:hypothetical protein